MIPAYHAGYVVDASVAVKWFADGEAHADKAQSLLSYFQKGHGRMVVPDWLFFLEMANAIGRKAGSTEQSVAGMLRELWNLGMDAMGTSPDLTAKTNAIAYGYKASVYDSTYVALAEVTGFPMVTADAELLKRMKGHSIVLPVWDLEFPK